MSKPQVIRSVIDAAGRLLGGNAARPLAPSVRLPDDVAEPFNAKRETTQRQHLCNAPFNNLYFTIKGEVGCCWLTIGEVFSDRWSPTRSVHEIWFQGLMKRVREAVAERNLHTYCKVCEHNIVSGRRPLAQAYDNEYPLGDYPSMMEMELSNLCNLECLMCNGDLSSRIRRNRDKLPPLPPAYTDQFVDELVEFLPHLRELRFNGGEPFLHKMVYKILDKVIEHNPNLMITMATNGTVVSTAVLRYLEQTNMYVNISLDSLTKEIYEGIRVNSKFEVVQRNFHTIRQAIQAKGRTMCVMVNPMRMNWHEMPEFVRFCNQWNVNLWFNTIQKPLELALWNLPRERLVEIYDTLSAVEFDHDAGNPFHGGNMHNYGEFVHVQLRSWIDRPELLK